jgi:hypothetical protein
MGSQGCELSMSGFARTRRSVLGPPPRRERRYRPDRPCRLLVHDADDTDGTGRKSGRNRKRTVKVRAHLS